MTKEYFKKRSGARAALAGGQATFDKKTLEKLKKTLKKRSKNVFYIYEGRGPGGNCALGSAPTLPPHSKNPGAAHDLEKEMWTAGYKYSWRKMEVAAQDRAGWRQVACGLYVYCMFHREAISHSVTGLVHCAINSYITAV